MGDYHYLPLVQTILTALTLFRKNLPQTVHVAQFVDMYEGKPGWCDPPPSPARYNPNLEDRPFQVISFGGCCDNGDFKNDSGDNSSIPA